jgi:glycosyltransferase involved in cell wall biosynthesis
MKVWILQTGEPLQIDNNGLRPMRAMNLSKALIDQGHHVTLWSSDFDHFTKQHRFGSGKTIELSENLTIRLINSRGYKTNIGISRLYDHFQLGWNLRKMIQNEEIPDLGFIGYPPIEPAWVMTKFLQKHSVPSVLDVKDAWPDVLVRGFHPRIRKLARVFLSPYYMMMNSTFKKSSFISSISPEFLNWTLEVCNRESKIHDSVNYLSTFPERHNDLEILEAENFWDSLGVIQNGDFRCSYIGSLTNVLALDRIIEAARDKKTQFVIAGTGSAAIQFTLEARNSPNIIFPGWISSTQAAVLAKRSTVMLAPYLDLDDFSISLPNKFLDAMSHGKPMLTSISGFAKSFVEKNNVGRCYSNVIEYSLRNLIEELSQNMSLVDDMGKNAEKIFDEQFNGNIIYLNLVRNLEAIALQRRIESQ